MNDEVLRVEVEDVEGLSFARVSNRAGSVRKAYHATAPLLSRMAGRRVAYFHAAVSGDSVDLLDVALAQSW